MRLRIYRLDNTKEQTCHCEERSDVAICLIEIVSSAKDRFAKIPWHKIHSTAVLVLCLLAATSVNLDAKIIDSIVAVVDDTTIMRSDLEEKAESMGLEYNDTINLKSVLEVMIDNIIIKKTYYGYGLPPIDPQDVGPVMKETGLEFEDALTFIMRQSLISMMVRSRVVVTNAMITEYYDATPEYCGRDSLRLRQIFIKSGQEKVDAAMAELNEGKDFDEVAKKYSSVLVSGSSGIGWVAIEDLSSDLKDPLSSAELGSIVGPLETKAGVLIFQVNERTMLGKKDPKEVYEEIKKILIEKYQKEAFEYWLDRTRSEHFVGNYL